MPNITLANGKIFNSLDGISILDSARNAGIVLEHSCRTGKCGICKARVSAGDTQRIQSEDSLSNIESQQNVILTCSRVATTDTKLDIVDLGKLADIKKMTLACKIDSLNYHAADVIKVVLRFPPNTLFQYIPGQYIDVIYKDIRRSYSIANAPTHDGKIELHIRRVHQGAMSEYWFNHAKVNDLLRLDGPHGTFCFREETRQNIIMLATGTGIAPIKSILESFEQEPSLVNSRKIYVFWGGRTLADMYWTPDFSNIDVDYHCVLSKPDTHWEGLSGYVQDAVLKKTADLSNSTIYACGSQKMIDSASQLLKPRGLAASHFFSDVFVSS